MQKAEWIPKPCTAKQQRKSASIGDISFSIPHSLYQLNYSYSYLYRMQSYSLLKIFVFCCVMPLSLVKSYTLFEISATSTFRLELLPCISRFVWCIGNSLLTTQCHIQEGKNHYIWYHKNVQPPMKQCHSRAVTHQKKLN